MVTADRPTSVVILSLGRDGECASPRVPVLTCRDALVAGGAAVETLTATSDAEVDAVLARLDGPGRPDGLSWPAGSGPEGAPALVVAADSDAQLRAVVRRMVRRYAPPPSRRPAELAGDRTVPDLPPIGVLPLDARGGPVAGGVPDLADRLRLPRDPADVAKGVLDGRSRRVDLFRTDAGSVTLHGALLGGVDPEGNAAAWRGRVEVDDTVLADGREPVIACAVANADGYAHLDEIPLAPAADPCSGRLVVAVALPVRAGRAGIRIEVRRATGRAVSISPTGELPVVDDGVTSTFTRKRAWWVEPGAWAVYCQ